MSRLELLLPTPRSLTSLGGRLILPAELSLRLVGSANSSAERRLAQALRKHGVTLFRARDGEQALIELALVSEGNPQGYRLRADAGRVRIEARDAAGLYYGVCTLEQLIEVSRNGDGRPR